MNKVATTIKSGHIAHRIHSMSRHMGSHLKAKFAHKYSTLKRESVFSMLPNELVMYIMEFLSLEDLCAALSVCQQWQAMGYAYNEHLWKMQCMSYWDNFLNRGELSTVLAEKSEDEQWEQFFTRKYNQEKQWKGAKFTQTTLAGHIGTVWSLGFDDKKLVTGSFDKTVKIWDRKTYKCIRTLRGHAYPIQCLQFQDNMLITGSLDNTIRVWDTDTGEFMGALATNAHNFDVFCLQFQGDRLISGSSDSTIRVWNMVSLECEQTLRHSSCVTCLQFDESRLVTGSADKFLKLWDLNAGVPVSILVGHLESVRCLQFTGNALISGSNDHTIKIWDLRSLKCAMTLRGHAGGVRCLQFHGSSLLSGSADRTIKLWDLRNAQPSMGHTPPSSPGGSNSPGDVILSHGTSVACLQWDGYTLAAGFSDAKVKVCSF